MTRSLCRSLVVTTAFVLARPKYLTKITDDRFGFVLSSANAQAAEACALGMHGYCYWRVDAMSYLGKATEQWDGAESLLLSMREVAATGLGSLRLSYRAAGVALCETVLAHRRSDFESVVEALALVRHDPALIGGVTRSGMSSINCC